MAYSTFSKYCKQISGQFSLQNETSRQWIEETCCHFESSDPVLNYCTDSYFLVNTDSYFRYQVFVFPLQFKGCLYFCHILDKLKNKFDKCQWSLDHQTITIYSRKSRPVKSDVGLQAVRTIVNVDKFINACQVLWTQPEQHGKQSSAYLLQINIAKFRAFLTTTWMILCLLIYDI